MIDFYSEWEVIIKNRAYFVMFSLAFMFAFTCSGGLLRPLWDFISGNNIIVNM